MSKKDFVFFGADGGCLDAYYLAIECHEKKIRKRIILSDSAENDYPDNSVHYGGFETIEDGNLSGTNFIYQCGNVKNHRTRNIWYEKACKNGLNPLSCISNDSYIHPTTMIGAGVLIYPGVRVMRNVEIKDNVIVLPNTVINHDSKIGSYTILNSGVIINGNVDIGKNCFIGAGTQVRECVCIVDKVTIGMGSLVLSSVNKIGIYYGRPVRA
jgi:sugar O-acyltransferase (sialic acid O-acetyltransferase NeuD family)